MPSPKSFHIIWAVDPFDTPTILDRSVLEAVRRVTKSQQATLELVYVLGRIDAEPEFGVNYLINLKPAADAAMASLVRMTGLDAITTSTVLVQNTASLHRSIDQLCQYANSRDADLIIVSTHARQGGARLILGSFSESLIARSPVDVLITKRGVPSEAGVSGKILHPVDFGDEHQQIFESAVLLAKRMEMGLLLYHVAIPQSLFPIMVNFGDGLIPLRSDSFLEDAQEVRESLTKLAEIAQDAGVEAEFRVDFGLRSQVAERIVRTAKANEISLIALCAERGPVKAAVMGSVVRRVIRDAHCPCWMIHHPSKTSKARLAA